MSKKSEATANVVNLTAQSGAKQEKKGVVIKRPNWATATVLLTSTAPYVQNRFANYKRDEMVEKQMQGSSQKNTRRNKPPKDFEKAYRGSMHISQQGWPGIPAMAIKAAMVDACRLTEVDMIRAKMAIRIIEDGLDAENMEPLVKITKGEPRMFKDRVKVGMNKTDIAARAIFDKWEARVTLSWDADIFEASDIVNLLARAGWQCGIGAGRPLSKTSIGTGKGTWEVMEQ